MNASWLRCRSRIVEPGVIRQRADAAVDDSHSASASTSRARRAVDDAGFAAMPREDLLQLLLQRRARQDAIDQIRPVERPDELDRVAQLQLRRDVAPDPRRRRRGERVQADAGKPRSRSAPSWRYSGRKSWPHWLMQCASSIAMYDDAAAAICRKLSLAVAGEPLGRHIQQRVAPLADARPRPRPSRPPPARCCSRPRRRRSRPACPPGPSSARSAARRRAPSAVAAPAPAPGSTATCRRRWAARRPSRGRRGSRPWLRAAADGKTCSPSIWTATLQGVPLAIRWRVRR